MDIVTTKSYGFAISIISTYKILVQNKKEFIMSKQLLLRGTSIGAFIREAEHGQSNADFLSKMNIALKEANETEYWLMLSKDNFYITEDEFSPLHKSCDEIIRFLVTIVKTTKASLNR